MWNVMTGRAKAASGLAVGLGVGLTMVMGGCAGGGSAGPGGGVAAVAGVDETPVPGREAVLTVYGMSCPLCASNVDQSLLAVPGVTAVELDMGTGQARVTLDGRTRVTRGELARAIDKSGFSLQKIETP